MATALNRLALLRIFCCTGVGLGKDHTIYALVDGKVTFRTRANSQVFVSVAPAEAAE